MRAAVSLVLVCACYGGGYDILAQSTGGECSSLDCPVMAGADVRLFAIADSDTGPQVLAVRRVAVSPADLAEVALDGDAIVMHAAAATEGTQPSVVGDGLGVLHVEMTNGQILDRDFTVRPRASLSIVADASAVPLELFPERKLPGERLAMFPGSTFELAAEFRDTDGNRLLGHDDSIWMATNLQLAAGDDTEPEYDTALWRTVLGTQLGPASVAFGTATFPIDVIAAHATARIEASGSPRAGTDGVVHLSTGEYTSLRVLAYADDGRFIFGGPPFIPLTVTSSAPEVAAIANDAGSGRTFGLTGYRSGTTTLTISFDGQTITVPVTVE